MTAIILAAGKGERLKPLTTQIPKPLITVAGKTLLQRNIDCLDRSGIKKIIVNGSRMGDQIESFLTNHKQSNISFDYINEGEDPLGTAGAIFNIIDKGLINAVGAIGLVVNAKITNGEGIALLQTDLVKNTLAALRRPPDDEDTNSTKDEEASV